MIDVERTFTVDRPMDTVVDYLRDFAHAEQWDPGTQSCTREDSGPIQVGSTWHNVSKLKGNETELTYRLERSEPDHLTFVGENKSATSTDDITFSPAGTGTSITYRAHIEFHGVAKVASPFLHGEFEKLGDATVEQLTRTVNAL